MAETLKLSGKMRVISTKKPVDKVIDDLWEEYATADRHGYKDHMSFHAFKNACKDLIKEIQK